MKRLKSFRKYEIVFLEIFITIESTEMSFIGCMSVTKKPAITAAALLLLLVNFY